MSGVIAQGDGRAVRRPDSALGAENEILPAVEFRWISAHPGILGHAEDIAARGSAKLLGDEGKLPLRARRTRAQDVDVVRLRFKESGKRHRGEGEAKPESLPHRSGPSGDRDLKLFFLGPDRDRSFHKPL